jgi:dolichol-phosphate mannosyltransferase
MFGLGQPKRRIETCDRPSAARVSIILPVLNEARRIGRCLDSLIAQPEEVSEILVVDGGSNDGTQKIAADYRSLDARVRLVDASPVDPRWTGKAWGLHFGLKESDPQSNWILTVDADLSASPKLVRSLLAHADKTGVTTFSVATHQHLSDKLDALIHPPMLTTLIYRYGSPGRAHRNPHRVQANGQCFLSRRQLLVDSNAFGAANNSLCEDITIVRRLAECGAAVGFYESDGLAEVTMYSDWRETWNNWPRSLPMRDQYFGWREIVGLAGILLFQALPLPTLLLGIIFGAPLFLLIFAIFLLLMRIGVLLGVARAYPKKPWTYWLSPIADLPVVLRIIQFALRKRHSWRGRTYVRLKGGKFAPLVQSE